MKNKISKNFISFLVLSFLLNPFVSFGAGSSTGLDVNLHVGSCNNNGVCEPGLGEDLFSCAFDCTPIVVPPDSDRGTSGSLVMDNSFNNLTVEVSYTSAVIKWQSFLPTISNLKWGTNPDYKDGVIKNINYLINHEVVITGLSEGTVYYFTIESESLLRKTTTLENQVFRTLSLLDTTPPANPTNVEALSIPAGITLSWENPKDLDFDYIRVMRNMDRFYGSPFSGVLVYEGRGVYFLDSKVQEGKKYFYSLFSRDRAGNYSSGTLVDIVHNPRGLDNWGDVVEPTEEVVPLPLVSFFVKQNSSIYDFKHGSSFDLDGDTPIIIKTDYSSNIKDDDLWVTIKDTKGKTIWQYMFSRIRDKDGYIKTTIPAFEKEGSYDVYIYKYYNKKIILVNQGVFNINKIITKEADSNNYYLVWYIIIILFLFLLLLLLYLIYRKIKKSIEKRREEREKNKK